MKEVKNLWSDEILQASDELLPVAILQQQAGYFNKMTKNVLVASVESAQKGGTISSLLVDNSELLFEHRLVIKAPMLGNYSFDLVRVEQNLTLPYPVEVYAPLTDKKDKAVNAEEVQTTLERIFNESKTLMVIQNLLTQSSFERQKLPF